MGMDMGISMGMGMGMYCMYIYMGVRQRMARPSGQVHEAAV
jgi:hypothetical protein